MKKASFLVTLVFLAVVLCKPINAQCYGGYCWFPPPPPAPWVTSYQWGYNQPAKKTTKQETQPTFVSATENPTCTDTKQTTITKVPTPVPATEEGETKTTTTPPKPNKKTRKCRVVSDGWFYWYVY